MKISFICFELINQSNYSNHNLVLSRRKKHNYCTQTRPLPILSADWQPSTVFLCTSLSSPPLSSSSGNHSNSIQFQDTLGESSSLFHLETFLRLYPTRSLTLCLPVDSSLHSEHMENIFPVEIKPPAYTNPQIHHKTKDGSHFLLGYLP